VITFKLIPCFLDKIGSSHKIEILATAANYKGIIHGRPGARERIKEMNVNDIREIARQRGIKPAKMKKSELIRAIQQDEGNPECFSTGFKEECGQRACLWRDDCDCAGQCR